MPAAEKLLTNWTATWYHRSDSTHKPVYTRFYFIQPSFPRSLQAGPLQDNGSSFLQETCLAVAKPTLSKHWCQPRQITYWTSSFHHSPTDSSDYECHILYTSSLTCVSNQTSGINCWLIFSVTQTVLVSIYGRILSETWPKMAYDNTAIGDCNQKTESQSIQLFCAHCNNTIK